MLPDKGGTKLPQGMQLGTRGSLVPPPFLIKNVTQLGGGLNDMD